MFNINAAVLGAGIIGLSTAVQLQERFENANVTIVADRFLKDTTSDGSAGIIQASEKLIPGIDKQTLKKLVVDSFNQYSKIASSAEASDAGISYISGYEVYVNDTPDESGILRDICFSYREAKLDEVKKIIPGITQMKYGCFYTTLIVESRFYLPWLTQKFLSKGGKIISKKINSISEVIKSYDIIINCTGLGSKELLNDDKLIPVRGQVLRVSAPWIKHFIMVDEYDCYVIPGKDTCVVGGTRDNGDFDLAIRSDDSKQIWKRACNYFPSLEKAVKQWEWTGLRPLRDPLRLELEIVDNVPVVHNYGHGGNGIALSWGCAKNAVDIAENYFQKLKIAPM